MIRRDQEIAASDGGVAFIAATVVIAALVAGCSVQVEEGSRVGGPTSAETRVEHYKPYQVSDYNSRPRSVAPVASSAARSTGSDVEAPPVAATGKTDGSLSVADGSARSVTIQAGDTLSGLARRHEVSVSELMSENKLAGPDIVAGQQLRLPRS